MPEKTLTARERSFVLGRLIDAGVSIAGMFLLSAIVCTAFFRALPEVPQ